MALAPTRSALRQRTGSVGEQQWASVPVAEQWGANGVLAPRRIYLYGSNPSVLPLPEWQTPVVTSYVAPWTRAGRVVFSPKRQRDTVIVQMDFAAYIGAGNSIYQVGSYQELESGVDYNFPSMTIESPQVNGTIVSYVIAGGVIGNTHKLSFFVNDGQLQNIQMVGYITIIPDIT